MRTMGSQWLGVPVGLVLSVACHTQVARATSNSIVTDSVNNYGPGDYLPNSIANGLGFSTGMTPLGSTFWSVYGNYTDGFVFDSHMVDNNIYSAGSDYQSFDRPGNAIAYFTGHGVCDAGKNPPQPCTSSANCTSPLPHQTLPGSCQDTPTIAPECRYWTDRHMITHGIWSWFNDDANLSYGLKWGESTNSGGWAGAGTNGGVNLVVSDVSCASVPAFESELFSVFAGLHLLATVMPIAGDTRNMATRGAVFASRWAVNSLGGVGNAWMDTLTLLPGPPSGGNSCGASGGGHGINGCGANHIISVAQTPSIAYNKVVYESWLGLKNDGNDAPSQGYWAIQMICNYDCIANPIVVP